MRSEKLRLQGQLGKVAWADCRGWTGFGHIHSLLYTPFSIITSIFNLQNLSLLFLKLKIKNSDSLFQDGFDMFNREWNLSFNVDFLIDKWEWYVDEDYSFKIHEITLFWDTKKNWKVFVKELANKVAVDYNKGDKVIGFNKKGLTKAITYARKQHFTWGSINIKASSLNNSKEKFIKFQLEFEYKGKRYNEEVEVLVYYWTVDDFVKYIYQSFENIKNSLERYAIDGQNLEYKK